MLKARRDAAVKVVQSLYAAEDAIDAAFARTAELNSTIVTARREAGFSALIGQEAIEMAASAFAALAQARSDIVEAHKKLSETKVQVGLRTVAIGDGVPKPQVAGSAEPRHLHAVA
ncbi:MAG TPA: hypothetical protein VD846_11100 [Allosphingosinicella sp.]|nr:hypothetical protein [Allosphingosinicella sp.]